VKKRILSLIVCMALVLGMMPTNALQVRAETKDPVAESGVSANAIFENESAEDTVIHLDQTPSEAEEDCDEFSVITEPVTAETAAAPDLQANPVYVGETPLQYAGDSVAGTGGGTATLYICQDGNPVLMLDNYVYEGAGYAYEENEYAGIYYGGSGYLLIMTGTGSDNRAASQSSIIVNAENAVSTKGICVPNANLIIGKPNSSNINDILTVSAGPATNSSIGIFAGKEIETIQDGKESTYYLYTTKAGGTLTHWVTSGCVINAYGGESQNVSCGISCATATIKGSTINAYGGNTTGGTESNSYGISCTTANISGGCVNATGGTAEGYRLPYSYGINCTGDATFSGGEITATGGQASYEGMTAHTLRAQTYGIKATSISITGATVTATGGTCGDLVSGKDNTRESYGCYGDITMTSGSLTATGADLLLPCNIINTKKSYGIYGSINVSGGTVNATGGNTMNGYCYGIYATGDCIFSGTADVTVKTNMEPIPAAVLKELNNHLWAGEGYSETVVEDYFKNTPEDGISWTLDYNGVTFYFGDGDLTEPGNGRLSATVSFAEYPELFDEKYTNVPEAYMVELPLDHSFFTDLDGDGILEELNCSGVYNETDRFYSQFGIYKDSAGSYHYEDLFAYGFNPYYVKTAAGNHYIYLFCEESESGNRQMMLVVCKCIFFFFDS